MMVERGRFIHFAQASLTATVIWLFSNMAEFILNNLKIQDKSLLFESGFIKSERIFLSRESVTVCRGLISLFLAIIVSQFTCFEDDSTMMTFKLLLKIIYQIFFYEKLSPLKIEINVVNSLIVLLIHQLFFRFFSTLKIVINLLMA